MEKVATAMATNAETTAELLRLQGESYGFLAPQDTFYIRQWLEGFLSDGENEAIKAQDKLGLYIYRLVRYKDVFNMERLTHFCRVIGTDKQGMAFWQGISGRNNAN